MSRFVWLVVLALLVAACGEAAGSVTSLSVASTSAAPPAAPTTLNPATTTSTAASATTTVPAVAGAFPVPQDGVIDQWVPEVRATYPHDPEAFTQGLLFDDGVLYESTGLYGGSSVRRVDVTTGDVLAEAELDEEFFGEGLALVDGELVQLTWQEEVAFTWDPLTLNRGAGYSYVGEGWGLCDTGTQLIMSDGSATLQVRDRTSFDPIATVAVTLDGESVDQLNELECVNGLVFANVWKTTQIVVIDPGTGEVTAVIDASQLPSPAENNGAAVLNGIAYDDVRGVFYLTGKLWPSMYEVVFVAG